MFLEKKADWRHLQAAVQILLAMLMVAVLVALAVGFQVGRLFDEVFEAHEQTTQSRHLQTHRSKVPFRDVREKAHEAIWSRSNIGALRHLYLFLVSREFSTLGSQTDMLEKDTERSSSSFHNLLS